MGATVTEAGILSPDERELLRRERICGGGDRGRGRTAALNQIVSEETERKLLQIRAILELMEARPAALGGAEAVVRRTLCAEGTGELARHLPDFVYAALVPFVGQREALRQSRAAARLLTEEE